MHKIFLTAFTSAIMFSSMASAGGEYCREYTKPVRIGGERQESYGTACRQPDGSWRIVSQDSFDDDGDDNDTIVIREERIVERPVYVYRDPWYPRARHWSRHHGGGHHRDYSYRGYPRHHSGVSFSFSSDLDGHRGRHH